MHDHDHHHHAPSALDWVKIALLAGLGGYFLLTLLTGNLTHYINYRFTWLSVVATGLFTIFAGYGLYTLIEQRRAVRDHDHHGHDHHHDHDHNINWLVLFIAAIPLALGLLLPSRPLGAEAINGTVSLSAVNAAGGPRALPADPLDWTVLDWLTAFNHEPSPSAFNGREAQVIGFVYEQPGFPADHFMVVRFTVSCCVADASAVGLPVIWGANERLPENTWVEITGMFEAGEFRGTIVPILHASQIEPIDQPAHPYLYP